MTENTLIVIAALFGGIAVGFGMGWLRWAPRAPLDVVYQQGKDGKWGARIGFTPESALTDDFDPAPHYIRIQARATRKRQGNRGNPRSRGAGKPPRTNSRRAVPRNFPVRPASR